MNNSETNKKFLASLDRQTRNVVLGNIANHYGISISDAMEEVCDEDAESIMDYITGDIRPTVNLYFTKFKASL